MATTASRTRGALRSSPPIPAPSGCDSRISTRTRPIWSAPGIFSITGEAAIADDPREAFELIHRAALRGAGIIVARANRDRRRRLPLNVWTALGAHRR